LRYRPSQVDDLTLMELHLLINENMALHLDPDVPTYEVTTASG